jgi:hypothetical protein
VWCRFTYNKRKPLCWGRLDWRGDYEDLPSNKLKREWRAIKHEIYRRAAEKEARKP